MNYQFPNRIMIITDIKDTKHTLNILKRYKIDKLFIIPNEKMNLEKNIQELKESEKTPYNLEIVKKQEYTDSYQLFKRLFEIYTNSVSVNDSIYLEINGLISEIMIKTIALNLFNWFSFTKNEDKLPNIRFLDSFMKDKNTNSIISNIVTL